ncbi:MAG: SUMF1/EgtB/PvdO family nonheme iron enzyme, partial [Bacteroidota bacterium]
MKTLIRITQVTLLTGSFVVLASCGTSSSPITGWSYNDAANGGFEVLPYIDQETGPGLVLVEGGTFSMGRVEQDVNYDWNTIPKRVTVSSFYIDETEIRNLDYLEYLHWLNRIYAQDETFYEIYKRALPDTLVWRSRLAFNEPYVEYYLRHPAYRDYPVVGVNWLQASDFCVWRTDRVNEYILV